MKCTNCLRSPCECETTAWAVEYPGRPRFGEVWRSEQRFEFRKNAVKEAKFANGRLVRIRRKVKR